MADSKNDLVAHLKQKTVTADEQEELTEKKESLVTKKRFREAGLGKA